MKENLSQDAEDLNSHLSTPSTRNLTRKKTLTTYLLTYYLPVQVGCRRASTEEGVLIHLDRSGVIAHLGTPGTGVRRTLTSVRQTRVRTRALVLMTVDDSPVSAWAVCHLILSLNLILWFCLYNWYFSSSLLKVVCSKSKNEFHMNMLTRSSAIRRESAHLTWLYCTVQMAFQYEIV